MHDVNTPQSKSEWTFLTNHGHTLICLAKHPHSTMREIGLKLGITERAVQNIIHDLVAEGYLRKERLGRRNQYLIMDDLPLRHPMERNNSVKNLIEALIDPSVSQNKNSREVSETRDVP